MPNILNWPKAVTKPIERSFARINEMEAEEICRMHGVQKSKTELKSMFETIFDPEKKFVPANEAERLIEEQIKKPVSLRSAVKAPPGWCIVSMDLKTAEVVVLAHISGDLNMLKVLKEPDLQFARISQDNPKKAVRVCFNENEGIPESEYDSSLLTPLDDPRILRDEQGEPLYMKRDLHWEMATSVAGKPREKLDEKLYRDGTGKVGNFSIPYGAAESLLERMIESNVGVKPPEGTGKRMIEAYETRYPTAARFLKSMELIPSQGGTYRSISGRVRHFFFNNLESVEGLSEYARNGILSPLTRQARNFPMQELVAATTAKALQHFIRLRNQAGLEAQCMMVLYDAMDVLCPFEEVKWVVENLQKCLTTMVPWTIHGRKFNFDVDVSLAFRWGCKMTKDEKKEIQKWL